MVYYSNLYVKYHRTHFSDIYYANLTVLFDTVMKPLLENMLYSVAFIFLM